MRLFLVATTCLIPVVIWAQTTIPGTSVETPTTLGDVLHDAMISTIIAAVPVITWYAKIALQKLALKLHLEGVVTDDATKEQQLIASIKVGIVSADSEIKQHGWDSKIAKDAILAVATDYMMQRNPQRTQTIIDAATPAGQPSLSPLNEKAAVAQTLAARLPETVALVAASPATPSTLSPINPTPMIGAEDIKRPGQS
jgi:hypothetical protein